MSTANTFMHGALAMASFFAVVLFLRFWKSTADRLFLIFAIAFSVLALDWIALGLLAPSVGHYAFVVRLVAFVAIIVGIVDKNRRRPRS